MRLLLAAILIAGLTGVAGAQDATVGRDAFLAADYATARRVLEPLADADDADALYWTGVMYSQGQGYAPDCQEAAFRYEQAAQQGHPEASFSLGFLLYYGSGASAADCELIPDREKAAEWLLRAAKAGKPRAQFMVGRMYMTGDGLPRGMDNAFDWLEKAANTGLTEAQYDLGLLYAQAGNRARAYFWFRLLAARGYPGAAQNAALLAKNLGKAEIEEADSRARGWKPVE
ncbi:MAG: sel1 repeat family protein [Proteobacteria bacterium]|nr:sel1 repeat family protein [Pseudomonadota bacterium]